MTDTPTPRTAIVTGASRGIGRAIAKALGSRGLNVAVNYFGNAEAAEQSAHDVEAAGGKAIIVQADVGRDTDRQRLVDETAQAFGPIDLLVNNAGIPPAVRADILDTDEAVWDRVMDTNLKGPFFLTQLVARAMVGQGTGDRGQEASGPTASAAVPPTRAVINLGSLSAYAGTTARSQYCIAKAGLRMMTQLFAARLAADGINVYEVCPGVIDTDMARGAKDKYDDLIHNKDLLPIARWGQPDDVAKAVLAIVDGYLPYSTGSVIDVDGGFHIRRL